jgi:hypothetical protein
MFMRRIAVGFDYLFFVLYLYPHMNGKFIVYLGIKKWETFNIKFFETFQS